MNVGRDRHGRKDERGSVRPDGRCPGVRTALALVAAFVLLSLPAAPAAAMTGGASAQPAPTEEPSATISFTKMRFANATWYGPGLYGNRTACGQVLRPYTIGVAHRSLPCGTAVMFSHRGRSVVARVIDRGPFVGGIRWDLTNGIRLALGFEGSGPVRYAISREAATAMRLRRDARRGG